MGAVVYRYRCTRRFLVGGIINKYDKLDILSMLVKGEASDISDEIEVVYRSQVNFYKIDKKNKVDMFILNITKPAKIKVEESN